MIRLLLIGLCLGLFSANSFAQERIIKTATLDVASYDDSLILAKNQNKKLIVFFTADYCGWCKKQKEVAFDPDVVNELNKDYIVCYVDTVENKDISGKYKVRTIPAYFIVDEKENVIKKNVGYKNKADFLRWLQY
jgi:thioredoxin-related protein